MEEWMDGWIGWMGGWVDGKKFVGEREKCKQKRKEEGICRQARLPILWLALHPT
jgi:hypothetical protein